MRKNVAQLLGFTALVLACQAQPHATKPLIPVLDGGARPAADAEVRADAAAADAGTSEASDSDALEQPAAAQCDAMRCQQQGEELARSFMASAIPLSVQGGDCTRVDIEGVVAGMACTCLSSNGWLYIGPKGAGCFARGRTGNCLWDDSEFEPCTQGDPKCSGLCQELQQRYAADAAKSFNVEVRASACRHGSCRHVLRVEDRCYTERSIKSGRHFDCNLSDADILEREDSAR